MTSTTENYHGVKKVPVLKVVLSDKNKKWLGVYTIWAIFNLICVLIGNLEYANKYFVPFVKSDLKYYDFSEFVFYTFLIPTIIYGYMWYKTRLSNKNKKWLCVYVIWLIFSLICVFTGESSEFVFYTFLIPTIIYGYMWYKSKHPDKANKRYYFIWVVLNLLALLYGNSHDAEKYFFPFNSGYLVDYDFGEFFIYTMLIPCVIYIGWDWYKFKHNK